MKRTLLIVCLNAIIISFGLPQASAKDAPASAEQLRSEVELAMRKRDTNALMALFNWEGVDDYIKRLIEWSIMPTRLNAVQDTTNLAGDARVVLAPLSSNLQAVVVNEMYGDNGRRTKFNFTPLGELDILTPGQSKVQWPYGKKGAFFYLAGLIAYQLPGKDLGIRVLRYPLSMTYTGSWTYVKDNQDITVVVSERTNRFKKGWGDYIKSCTIQRTSINQPGHGNDFRFEVWEGGTKVFVSPPMTNEDPVIYQRKQ